MRRLCPELLQATPLGVERLLKLCALFLAVRELECGKTARLSVGFSPCLAVLAKLEGSDAGLVPRPLLSAERSQVYWIGLGRDGWLVSSTDLGREARDAKPSLESISQRVLIESGDRKDRVPSRLELMQMNRDQLALKLDDALYLPFSLDLPCRSRKCRQARSRRPSGISRPVGRPPTRSPSEMGIGADRADSARDPETP